MWGLWWVACLQFAAVTNIKWDTAGAEPSDTGTSKGITEYRRQVVSVPTSYLKLLISVHYPKHFYALHQSRSTGPWILSWIVPLPLPSKSSPLHYSIIILLLGHYIHWAIEGVVKWAIDKHQNYWLFLNRFCLHVVII